MALQLKPRNIVEDEVENWDDDDFMIDTDDLSFRSGSTTHASSRPGRRDSHTSFRSDRDSLFGDDDRQVHLAGEDEKSTMDAIFAVQHAGIPIPQNVPPSALMGGTIKRLGGRKVQKIIHEDWGDEIELPKAGTALRIKPQDASQYPETLRQVSGTLTASPVRLMKSAVIYRSPKRENLQENIIPTSSPASTLDRFRDNDDDDDVFGDGGDTIRAPKFQQPPRLPAAYKPLSLVTPPTPRKKESEDDFEMHLELPTDGTLQLSSRREIPRTPSVKTEDDFDWGEGSLGTRFGGTRREVFSTRSSNASAMSPSIASSITAESEDDALDGLILPIGPLDLNERLMLRKQSASPERPSSASRSVDPFKKIPETPMTEKEDDLDGLEFEDGDVFGSGKLSLHRNVKVKETRQSSPARPKASVSVTISNKPVPAQPSRLPRPAGGHHERSHTQSSLETVSESGGPVPYRPSRRSQSRLGGHSATSSTSSIVSPATPSSASSFQPSTPRRRELGSKTSLGALRNESSTTTNAQLLRFKRSLPAIKSGESPARPGSSRFERPTSLTETHRSQFQQPFRPKTPVDRNQAAPSYQGSAAQARRPFLPAGSGSSQSHHVSTKPSSRLLRRHDSDVGPQTRPLSRTLTRPVMRSPSPRRLHPVEKIAAEPWQQLSKPRRVKQFGDGTELDAFDDLPTSAHAESKFVKQPVAARDRNTVRNKMPGTIVPERNGPALAAAFSPARADNLPHFARDTAASRKAREVSLAQRAPPTTAAAPPPTQRVAQLSSRAPHLPHGSIRSKKSRKPPQLKPHLITNMNAAKDTKVINGMTYNPDTCKWEGNETVLNAFDPPVTTPTMGTTSPNMTRDKESMTTPRPYLITNMGASNGIKREGNMVFDPVHFRWIEAPGSNEDDPLAGFDALDDEDPFKDIPDLEDKEHDNSGEGGQARASDVGSEWLVGEEFDVGPEFIRRQREEEERWRKKCERWINTDGRDSDAWRWALRDIVQGP
ncbi:hypothetical protein E8E14_014439 [Neopestalotiopsis sp. 37M]|nr:hypothetical protein E8E14_014439 [Neopestalotiopsis sp. 37M]